MSSLPNDPPPDAVSLRLSPESFNEYQSENTREGSGETGGVQEQMSAHPGMSNPLNDAHFEQLERAAKLAKPVEKAVRYAQFSGWMTLLAGASSLPFAIGNLPMMIFALIVAGIGTRELTIGRTLRVLDMTAPKRLAINQVLLGSAVCAYAIFMLLSVPGEGMVESAMKSDPMMQSTPEIGGMMNDMIQLEQVATAMMYVLMIVLAIVMQGGTALYYLLKGRRLKSLHRQTPQWVVDVYRAVHR